MEEIINRVVAHRDRFQSWGLFISILALLAAVWITAPALEVEIPLVGGAKASINAGYVMVLGPTFIAFAQCWSIGSLVAMRRYQLSALKEHKDISDSEKLSIFGPLVSNKTEYEKHMELPSISLFRKSRSIIFFLVPALAQIIILSNMLDNLHYYNEDIELVRFKQLSTEDKAVEGNWGLKTEPISIAQFLTSKYPEKGSSYTLQNSGLNNMCGAYIYFKHLKLKTTLTEDELPIFNRLKDANPKCVPMEFPRFELALNTWINIIMLFFSVTASYIGMNLYSSRGLEARGKTNKLLRRIKRSVVFFKR